MKKLLLLILLLITTLALGAKALHPKSTGAEIEIIGANIYINTICLEGIEYYFIRKARLGFMSPVWKIKDDKPSLIKCEKEQQ